jgi:pimeloyl-ACP methyl ester carboxylesterase
MEPPVRPRVLEHDIAGEGDPLILVPGGLTGWVSWIPHQDHLSTRRRVIRVQPIHNELGSAGKPGDPGYTRQIERESLRLTLDELDIEQGDFAGWSGGGKALIDFTVAHGDRVRSLTLVEPAAYWILEKLGEMSSELDEFIRYLYSFSGQAVTEDNLAVFLSKAGFVVDSSQARDHPYWERAMPHMATLSWLSESLMSSDAAIEDLSRIECPTLLTKGTTTEPWEKRVVDLLGEYLPNSGVVELQGGHAHHIESIDPFLEELEKHLTTVRTR